MQSVFMTLASRPPLEGRQIFNITRCQGWPDAYDGRLWECASGWRMPALLPGLVRPTTILGTTTEEGDRSRWESPSAMGRRVLQRNRSRDLQVEPLAFWQADGQPRWHGKNSCGTSLCSRARVPDLNDCRTRSAGGPGALHATNVQCSRVPRLRQARSNTRAMRRSDG
jgi:hypothetical protein